ncbi:MAG: LysR family transcriptional regulator [Pseudomonadota bacterium]
MTGSLPPLTWFRSFEAAARHLSFTAAADELGLTQSAISQQVRSLEMRLGVELFHRRHRGISLTDDGRKLQPKVGSALDSLAQATASYEIGSNRDLLTIATSVSIAQWIVAPRLKGFMEDHPGLRVRILSTIWPDDFKALLADVEIRFGSDKQVGADAERLLPDSLIAIARPDLDGSLEDQTLIEAVGTSETWRDWARLTDYGESLRPSIFVDSHGASLDMALHGNGVALTSSLLAAQTLETNSLIQIHPTVVPSSEGYFLATKTKSDASFAFGTWLKKIAVRAVTNS